MKLMLMYITVLLLSLYYYNTLQNQPVFLMFSYFKILKEQDVWVGPNSWAVVYTSMFCVL